MSRRGLLLVAWFLAMLHDTVVSQTPLSLSAADIQELVDAHNLFRGRVDPPASNIQSLQWNEELARVAQAHAASCSLSENTNRADNVSFATVGENLSASNAGAPNYTRFVEMGWFSQRDNYDFQSNMCTTQDSCTDYIQLVWANTTELGCGAVRCPAIDGFPILNSVLLVCNYAPEGRIENGRPYIVGNFCSDCSDGAICVNNLCTPLQPTTPPPPITTQIISTTVAVTTNPSSPTEPITSIPPSTNPPTTIPPTTNPPTTIPPTTNPPTTIPPTTTPPTTIPPTTNPPTTIPPSTNPPTTTPPTTNPPTTLPTTREETTITTIPSTTGSPITTHPVTTAATTYPTTTQPCDLPQTITKLKNLISNNNRVTTVRKKVTFGIRFIAYVQKVVVIDNDESKTDCSTPKEKSDSRPRRRKTRWSKSKSKNSRQSSLRPIKNSRSETKSKNSRQSSLRPIKNSRSETKSKNSRQSRLRSIKNSRSETKRRSPKRTKKPKKTKKTKRTKKPKRTKSRRSRS